MIYHFGFFLYSFYNDNIGCYISYILSVSHGKLKLYYYLGQLDCPKMSFVFFGVKYKQEASKNYTFVFQSKERWNALEVTYIDLISDKNLHYVDRVYEKYSGADYEKNILLQYDDDYFCCAFYKNEWLRMYFSDKEESWCKQYVINHKKNEEQNVINSIYRDICNAPNIVGKTNIEEIVSHLKVVFSNGTITRVWSDDWQYDDKETSIDIEVDVWLAQFLELGRKDTSSAKWRTTIDYKNEEVELIGDENKRFCSEIVQNYNKLEHLNGLLARLTIMLKEHYKQLSILDELLTNELIAQGNIQEDKFYGMNFIIAKSKQYDKINDLVYDVNKEMHEKKS